MGKAAVVLVGGPGLNWIGKGKGKGETGRRDPHLNLMPALYSVLRTFWDSITAILGETYQVRRPISPP
jgi:hypothetical protein